jgi:hydrogenase maturation protease
VLPAGAPSTVVHRGAARDDPCLGCLLELVRGFTRVIIIDVLKSPAEAGREPGEVVKHEAEDFKGGQRRGSAHSIGLDTVLELGHRPGYEMPAEVIVYAIGAADVETFGEELSPPVSPAAEHVLELVREELGAI